MSQPFDPTLKALVEISPDDWPALLGLPPGPVTVEDADLATVLSSATDKVLHVRGDPEYVLHLDFQSGHDSAELPRRLRLYNGVLDHRHDCPVVSAAVLLHRGADSPQLTGRWERGFPGQEPISTLRYRVVRVWQLPPEQLLSGGLGLLALAPISDVPQAQVPDVIARMKRRLDRRPRPRRARDVWAAAYVLLGLAYSEEFADRLYREVLGMEQSATYRAIVAKGEAKGVIQEARKILLRVGARYLGRPDRTVMAAVDAIADVEQLEHLVERAPEAANWQELLGVSVRRRRRSEP